PSTSPTTESGSAPLPAYKLDVAGDVRFTGTLRGGTVPWERLSGVPSASTSSAGIVQLTDSVSSDSVTTAATPRTVKQAIERARESPIAIKAGHLFHFDHGLQSTRGLRPLPGAVATLRPGEGRFGGAVAVEEGTENLVGNPIAWKPPTNEYQTTIETDERLFGCVVSETVKLQDGTPP